MKVNFEACTGGEGLWSERCTSVGITNLCLGYLSEEKDFADLRAVFEESDWNVETDGLIYTDELWMFEFKLGLQTIGFSEKAVNDISYSEQGMQGLNFVSMDVGANFLTEWFKVSVDTEASA